MSTRSVVPSGARPVVLLGLALLVCAPPAAAQALSGPEAARRWREAREAEILREFADLLAIPNVAADRENIRRNADWIVARLEGAGVDAEALTLPGANPIVVGELRVPGATRTLGVYVHYDGQPADPANWTHDPWQPTLYSRSMEVGGTPVPLPAPGEPVDPEARLYGRSAGDDKAPIGALLPVLRSFRDAGVVPTSNVVFLFDGEEEAGSEHLGDYLETWRERFDPVDVWLFFDGPVHASGRPQLTFGVRGVTGLSVTVYGATRSLHSGHYGNWAPVPGQRLAELLASMKDAESGRVLVDGFYDTVEPIGEAERRALAFHETRESRLVERPAQEVTLDLVAVVLGEKAELVARLDAFGDHRDVP
ncbi:MAG: M20/M25/M40 family metallo-hydrolase [Gemmatimonadetes bacterium]|nr:M20/M25/M40 family metallo-hydrolase [Gemmatimonadota bacterium]